MHYSPHKTEQSLLSLYLGYFAGLKTKLKHNPTLTQLNHNPSATL